MGCSFSGDKPKNLTIWLEASSKQFEIIKQARSVFLKDNPDAIIVLKQVPFNTVKPLVLNPREQAPDIFLGVNDWLSELVKEKRILPINKSSLKNEFYPQTISPLIDNGELWAIPYSFEYLALFYNKKYIPPKKIIDFLSKNKDINSPLLGYDVYNLYYHFAFLSSLLDGAFSKKVFETSEMHESINSIKMLLDKKIIVKDCNSDIARNLFLSGKIPYYISGPWDIENIIDISPGIAPIPSLRNKPSKPFLGIKCFYISKDCKNKELAISFLNTLLDERFQSELSEINVPPANIKAETGKSIYMNFFFKNIKNTTALPGGPIMKSIWSIGNAFLYRTIHDNMNYKKALNLLKYEEKENSI